MKYDFLTNVYNTMSDGIYAFDLNGEITNLNPAAQRMLEYTEEELQGTIAHFAFHAHSAEVGLLQCPIYKAFLNDFDYVGEAIFVTKSRKLIDVSVSCNPLFEAETKIGYVVSFRDISEKKRVEKERDALYEIVKNTDDIVVIKDLNLRVIATNNAFVKASGRKNIEELIGKTDAEIFGVTDDFEPIASYMADEKKAQSLPRGKSIIKEEPVIYPDGSIRVFKTRKFPIYKHDKVFATANISVDVTHETAYAKDLESKISKEVSRGLENDAIYNKIFSTANLGICLTNTEGRFVVVNPAYCDIYGYEEAELIGSHFSIVVPLENQAMMQKLHDDFLLHHREELALEWEVVRKDGKRIHIYASAGILENIIGGPYKITTISDITEMVEGKKLQKEQESLLVQQSKLAAMGEMIGHIAHQWRQPLNVINCTTLDMKLQKDLDSLSDEKLANALLSIEALTDSMSETINDFMNFYRPDKHKRKFSLLDMTSQVYKIIAPQLKNDKIELSLNIDKSIELFGPSSELQQVILNLISNAKDAFLTKQIENKQICLCALIKGTTTFFYIEDNAGGIKETLLEKIFEPYFTTKESLNGSGIGLYMSAMIIKQSFGGSILVDNIVHNDVIMGARFTLEFPQKD